MPEFEKYYEEEMRYLREAGKEFASAFPEKARYLNIDAVEDRDPYVERLFEGFAFLTGRIRQKLDDDFPEFSHNLMEMVDPSFLRSIPSMCMLQFDWRASMLQGAYTIPKGTVMLSTPVGSDKIACRFQSSQSVTLFPFHITSMERFRDFRRGDGFRLRFDWESPEASVLFDPDSIPLYLHGDRTFAYRLHHLLVTKLRQIEVEAGGKSLVIGNQKNVVPGGFSTDENLLPILDSSFEGNRYLKEFFCFDEKFRYANISGLGRLRELGQHSTFNLVFYFNETLPESLRVNVENFKLFTSPAVNLFADSAIPVHLNHKHFEYHVIPDSGPSSEVYEVQSVIGSDKATGSMRDYHKFSDFRHKAVQGGDRAAGVYYQVRQERMGRGRFNSYLSIASQGQVEKFAEEYVSISLISTNGGLPREALKEGDVTVPTGNFPGFSSFTNFTRPTAPIYPPRAEHYLWNVLSHMNMNYRSLTQDGNLKEVMALYDWSHAGANRKIIEGVITCRLEKKNFLIGSQLARGTEINVSIKDGTFSETGEQFVFGRILLEFFTQYSTINHLVSLQMTTLPSGALMRWEPLEGRCHSL